jgi:hypothetical protein
MMCVVCRVSCIRRGRRGSFEIFECCQLCEDNFKAFKFQDTGKQYGLDPYPNPEPRLCSDAFENCVDDEGEVDEDCLLDYELCEGNIPEHCDLACIRTPSLDCQEQCRAYYKTFDDPRMPASSFKRANRRNIYARKF